MPNGHGHIGETADTLTLSIPAQKQCRVVVVGNEKGGAGKSTVSIHLAIALMRMDQKVGVIDLDVRQRTLTRYLENRMRWMQSTGAQLPMPEIIRVDASAERDLDLAEKEETERFHTSLERLKAVCDVGIVDAPGGDTYLSRIAHMAADTLVTPLNDSFVDFDLLGDVNPQTLEVLRPSFYSEMVWQCRKNKARTSRQPIDWIAQQAKGGRSAVQLVKTDRLSSRAWPIGTGDLSRTVPCRSHPARSDRERLKCLVHHEPCCGPPGAARSGHHPADS